MAFLSGEIMSYYDEVLNEIRCAIAEGSQEEAAFLLKRELSMPYIPSEIEEQLLALQKDLRYQTSGQKEKGELSTEALLRRLKGKPESQLRAVSALCDRNLRSITAELRDWLSKDPQPEAASLLIDALAEQEVPEEFTIVRNGVEYSFFADAVTPVAKSGGFREALRLIGLWLAKDPSLTEMARSILVQRCYLALPLSYELQEGAELASSCIQEVLVSMGMEDRMDEIICHQNSETPQKLS
jgi:hypothetical protein